MIEGRNFPQKSQLQFTTGVLDTTYISPRSIKHLILIDPVTKKQTEFSCSYSAYNKLNVSACYLPLKDENLQNNVVTIGWYYQEDFLGFHNPLPQVVTLKLGQKQIITYEKTFSVIENVNHGRKVLSIFFTIFVLVCGVLAHFIFGKENKS